jgi:hypothetical protein
MSIKSNLQQNQGQAEKIDTWAIHHTTLHKLLPNKLYYHGAKTHLILLTIEGSAAPLQSELLQQASLHCIGF